MDVTIVGGDGFTFSLPAWSHDTNMASSDSIIIGRRSATREGERAHGREHEREHIGGLSMRLRGGGSTADDRDDVRSVSTQAANNRDDFDEPKHPYGIDGSQVGLTAGTLYVDYPCKFCGSTLYVQLNPSSCTHAKDKGRKFSQHCGGTRHREAKAASLAGLTDAPSSQPHMQVIRPELFLPDRSPPCQWTPLNVTTFLKGGGTLTLVSIEDFAVEYTHPPTTEIRYAVQAVGHPARKFNTHYSGPGATLKQTYKCIFPHDEPIAVWLDRDVVDAHFGDQLRAYESTLWSLESAWRSGAWEPRQVLRAIYLDWQQLRAPRLARHLLSVENGESTYSINGLISVEQQQHQLFVFADDPQRPTITRRVWLPEECKSIFNSGDGSLPFAKKQRGSVRDRMTPRTT